MMAAGRLPTAAAASLLLLLLMPLSLLARPTSVTSESVLSLAPSESVPSPAGVEGGPLDPYLNADLAEYKDGGGGINGTGTIPEVAAGVAALNSTTSQVQDIRSKLPKNLPPDAKAGEAILNGIQDGTSDGGPAVASFSVLSASVAVLTVGMEILGGFPF
ncbi:hypothetical protein QJS04_geneDACA004229 [Acorus gramineus]|uniref:Uncharacterized protein n=1 Tax=Acorus gramineus TaxID=55184 RepID=A0AAV9B345_ACOGR|nr:hypothetical protein QJS04_geneDACA004229 [Acorus gramineus]